MGYLITAIALVGFYIMAFAMTATSGRCANDRMPAGRIGGRFSSYGKHRNLN